MVVFVFGTVNCFVFLFRSLIEYSLKMSIEERVKKKSGVLLLIAVNQFEVNLKTGWGKNNRELWVLQNDKNIHN